MKKRFITYLQHGKVKKAVLDENRFKQISTDPTIKGIVEYENELIMEKRFAEKLGVSDNRKTLLD